MSTIIDLIDFLKSKRPETTLDSGIKTMSIKKFNDLVDELSNKRINFLKENFGELKQKTKQNYKKLRVPLFSLMEYDWNENSHSNILQYLLDHNSFKTGPDILARLVTDSSKDDKKKLCEKILKRTYTIEREFAIPSGRLDLFILDETERFVIIIENKLFAGIGKTESDDEIEIPITQLEVYEKWSAGKYPNYMHQYILLNFFNTESDTSLFEKVTYKQLFDILTQFDSDDNIFDEYVLLLKYLLNPVSHDLFRLKKLSNKIIESESPEISLIEYYTLKEIFYAS